MKNTRRIISMVLTVIMMLLPLSSLGATGHIDGCTNTDFSTNCCTKTFIIIPKTGYRVLDVIVNGVSKGAITSYTFTNITGPQNLKVITEPIGGTTPGGGSGTGGETPGGGTETGIKVKFNANGGIGSMPSQTFEEGVTQYLNPCTYTKDGFDFVGWSTTATGDVEYEDECIFSTTETLTLYAVWGPAISSLTVGTYLRYEAPNTKSYTGNWVIFKNNNGQLDIISKESTESKTMNTVEEWKQLVKILNNLASEYVNGTYATHARTLGSTYPWNASGTTAGVSVGTVGTPPKSSSSNFPYSDTLYQADVNIINSCVVSGGYPLRHTSGNVWLASRSTAAVFSDGDYCVDAYYLKSDGTAESDRLANSSSHNFSITAGLRPVVSLKTNLMITGGSGTSSDPYTIGVKPAKTYRVTFDSNGGMGTMSTQTFAEGETKNLTTNAFTNLGKNFLGWATSSDGSVQLTDGQSYIPTGHITLYAVWANQCTVKFSANGGTGTMADQIFVEGVAQALPENAFTKTGYYFTGWSTTAGGTVEYIAGDNYTTTEDKTLYAIWGKCYTVLVQGSSSYATVKVNSKSVSAGTHYLIPGDTLNFSVTSDDKKATASITFNSNTVASVTNSSTSYAFIPNSDVNISVSTNSVERVSSVSTWWVYGGTIDIITL